MSAAGTSPATATTPLPPWASREGDRLLLDVRVQPRASRDRIGGVHDGALKIQTTAPPVDDAANRRIIVLLATALGVPRASVSVVSGHRGRRKRIAVTDPTRVDASRLAALG